MEHTIVATPPIDIVGSVPPGPKSPQFQPQPLRSNVFVEPKLLITEIWAGQGMHPGVAEEVPGIINGWIL